MSTAVNSAASDMMAAVVLAKAVATMIGGHRFKLDHPGHYSQEHLAQVREEWEVAVQLLPHLEEKAWQATTRFGEFAHDVCRICGGPASSGLAGGYKAARCEACHEREHSKSD